MTEVYLYRFEFFSVGPKWFTHYDELKVTYING